MACEANYRTYFKQKEFKEQISNSNTGFPLLNFSLEWPLWVSFSKNMASSVIAQKLRRLIRHLAQGRLSIHKFSSSSWSSWPFNWAPLTFIRPLELKALRSIINYQQRMYVATTGLQVWGDRIWGTARILPSSFSNKLMSAITSVLLRMKFSRHSPKSILSTICWSSYCKSTI